MCNHAVSYLAVSRHMVVCRAAQEAGAQQIEKEVKSNPKQPSCKKKSAALKKAMVKKDQNPRWRPRNGCDDKNFNNDNSGEFCVKTKRHQNSPESSLLKFLPLTYHHSHFLAATLDFTSFFTIAFLRAALFFSAWLFWIRLAILDIRKATPT